MRRFVGIGSRKQQVAVVEHNQIDLSRDLAKAGFVADTGGAKGSDYHCATGTLVGGGVCRIWRGVPPGKKFTPGTLPPSSGSGRLQIIRIEQADFDVARDFFLHTGTIRDFDKMDPIHQWLHARNYYQIMGIPGDPLPELVHFAAPETRFYVEGGTRTAVAVARYHNVPNYNLQNPIQRMAVKELVMEITHG